MTPHETQRGFTLLELLVGMGLLTALLAVLVQILSTGVTLFGAGERGQALADRTHTAARAPRRALQSTVGPTRPVRAEEADPEARLLAYDAPLGLSPAPGRQSLQLVRATVALDEAAESRLLADRLRDLAAEEVGSQDVRVLEAHLRELVARWPRRGRGELLLLPWPSDAAGVHLELREGLWPADPELSTEGIVPLTQVIEPRDLDLDPDVVQRATRVVATGLLHVEFEFWTQFTTAWRNTGRSGPVSLWDSARAGLLFDEQDEERSFALDRVPTSLRDARDDIWPRWVRVVLVVGHGAASAPEALLTAPLGVSDREMVINRVDRLPDLRTAPWLKIGAEWVRVGAPLGRELGGLRRGERGTRPLDHPAGTAVRAGREVELIVRLPHGRDADV